MEGESADVARAERVLDQLAALMRGGYKLAKGDVKTAAQLVAQDDSVELADYFLRGAPRTSGKRQVLPKSVNQRRYLDAIEKHDIVFGIGPAGTGKTYLAMAQAVSFLLAKRVSRIILARPAVEAGEKLGFLPGDLQEKVNPYLRPLYDALYDMIELERAERLIERGTIEVAPIAFMRGRTLNDAFVILDEAQNTTSEQMKMFLTRLGFGSKAVITGDITQIDLPTGRTSGLVEAMKVVGNDRGHRVRPFRRQGRRAPPAGAADRQGVRSPTVDPDSSRLRVTVTRRRTAAPVRRWRTGRLARPRRPGRALRGEVAIALVSDARMRDAQPPVPARGHAHRRAFVSAAESPSARTQRRLGDIVIATGVARRQAREARPFLPPSCGSRAPWFPSPLGYDHDDPDDHGRMARARAAAPARAGSEGLIRASVRAAERKAGPRMIALLLLLADGRRLRRHIETAFSALMRLSLRLMAERGGRDDRLGYYLDDPIQLFVPARLMLGLIFSLATVCSPY